MNLLSLHCLTSICCCVSSFYRCLCWVLPSSSNFLPSHSEPMRNQNGNNKILRGDLKIAFTAEKGWAGGCCLGQKVNEPELKKQADLFTQGTGQEGATGSLSLCAAAFQEEKEAVASPLCSRWVLFSRLCPVVSLAHLTWLKSLDHFSSHLFTQ